MENSPSNYLAERDGRIYLKPANQHFKDIELNDGQELAIWGVVTVSKTGRRCLDSR